MKIGISISITSQLRSSFSPASLFAAGEPGVWFDPSDMTTLFQDSAGTTPVTSPAQPVGLMLDKSQGLVLGGELRGTGAIGSAGTVAAGSYNTSTGEAVLPRVNGSNINFVTVSGLSGRTCLVDVQSTSASGVTVRSGSTVLVTVGAGQRITCRVAIASGQNFSVFPIADGSTTTATIHSVKELPGNHATQSTAASRPIYAVMPKTGIRNQLTYTEQFDNAAWIKGAIGTATAPTVTANAAVAPDGTLTADLAVFNRGTGTSADRSFLSQAPTLSAGIYTQSVWLKAATSGDVGKQLALRNVAGTTYLVVTLTDAWVRYEKAETWSVNTFEIANRQGVTADVTVSAYIWGAQLETGSTATAYQKVVSKYDVTEAGVQSLSYLSFDGIDDGMVTSTITPGIDKTQVFAGVRKLSDAATGIIAELSANVTTNAGALDLRAPSGATSTYQFTTRGSSIAAAAVSPYAAPITNIVTGIGDISGDVAALRVNGTQVAQSTADQGTGNYLAYPLYIGRRGGTSLPFNGNLYGLIVRFGANLDASSISNAETWMNQKTGAY